MFRQNIRKPIATILRIMSPDTMEQEVGQSELFY